MVCSSFLAVNGICRLSPSKPFASLSLEMNFSTKFRMATSFCSEKSPDADTKSAVTLSSASAKGD
jgi:hypothetical protein